VSGYNLYPLNQACRFFADNKHLLTFHNPSHFITKWLASQ